MLWTMLFSSHDTELFRNVYQVITLFFNCSSTLRIQRYGPLLVLSFMQENQL